ncbi:hypothetical protein J4209_03895 [Candidatus Woesearchaeota archaeon]|nr:hypothetical protein [Candidatus Woesearchaeota archaeon]
MELNITEKKEEPLLSRVFIKAELFYKGPTISNKDVKTSLASSLGADEKLIVVKHIYSSFGSGNIKITAYKYNSEKDIKIIEPKQKEKKGAVKEAPQEQPKAEGKK